MSSSTFFGGSPNTFTDYETLPRDMQKEIIHHMPTKDLTSMWFTSKSMQELINEDIGLRNKISPIITIIKKITVINQAIDQLQSFINIANKKKITIYTNSFIETTREAINKTLMDSGLFEETIINDINVSMFLKTPTLESYIPKILSHEIELSTVDVLLLKPEARINKLLTDKQIEKLKKENKYKIFKNSFNHAPEYCTLFVMEKLITPDELADLEFNFPFLIYNKLFTETGFWSFKKKLISLSDCYKMDLQTMNEVFLNKSLYPLYKRRAFLDHPDNWRQAGATDKQSFEDRFNQLTPILQLVVTLGASLNTAEKIQHREALLSDLVERVIGYTKEWPTYKADNKYFHHFKKFLNNYFEGCSEFLLASWLEDLVSFKEHANSNLYTNDGRFFTSDGYRRSLLQKFADSALSFCLLKDQLITVNEVMSIDKIRMPELLDEFSSTCNDLPFLLARKEFILNPANQLAANAANSEELRPRLIRLPFKFQREVVRGTLALQKAEELLPHYCRLPYSKISILFTKEINTQNSVRLLTVPEEEFIPLLRTILNGENTFEESNSNMSSNTYSAANM